jgi:tyrosyl-tRNA synthetase
VQRVTQVLFDSASIDELNDNDLDALANEIPTVTTGRTIIESLVEAGVVSSNGEARRLINGGGVMVNGERVSDDRALSQPSLIKKGKNSFVLVRP